jgi:hypothetical protein
MIDINDLSIGDYVMFNGEVLKVEEISKKGWIHLEDIDTDTRVRMTSDYIIKNLEPIPLTTEIFEKNGFKKVDYDYLKPNVMFESKDCRVRITDVTNSGDGYWNVHIDNEDFETVGACDVKYVHQFQQLLQLCGYEMEVVV